MLSLRSCPVGIGRMLLFMAEQGGAWRAAVHGVTESDRTEHAGTQAPWGSLLPFVVHLSSSFNLEG